MHTTSPALSFKPYQINIIRLWAEYPTVADVADQLNRSEHTVQTHLKRLRRKLNVHRTFDVYLYMVRAGHLTTDRYSPASHGQ